ncbi:MAG TPA: amidohydrolase family protein [Acetobacteraceae bacterium]|nr:amidohydrolase family protein [Acetobacteraceae bacterium]
MNVAISPASLRPGSAAPGVIDCDIHPGITSARVLFPWLSPRWQAHLETYGLRQRHGFQSGTPFPKGQPQASRRDAFPPGGGKPGSDLDFMRAQHLDANGISFGILNPLAITGQGTQNPDLSAALARAVNEWQVACWTTAEPRLRASIVVPYEDGQAAAAEIEHWTCHPEHASHFTQVLLLSRTAEPLGQRRYWPIYEAAARHGLPVAVHAFGYGGYPITAGGWPSYYIEEMVGHAQCAQSLLTSMVFEGVFERFAGLRVVIVEAGFAWLPALAWRLDRAWARNRDEVPHLGRAPSEVIAKHVWLTSQPMEEPARRRHLPEAIGWIGWDRLLFATDYPHWDYDDPSQVLPMPLAEQKKRDFFLNNAVSLYGVG